MQMYIIGALLLCLGLSDGFFFSPRKWNDLKVRWAIGFGRNNFQSQPRTETDALNEGFTMVSDCGDVANFAGKRYVKDGDTSVVLIFDAQGFIAGIQAGFPKMQSNGYPSSYLVNHPFVLHEDRYYITAYFVEPHTICDPGRTSQMFSAQGTGTGFYIQNGTSPTQIITIPMQQDNMAGTMWTRGKCFPTMGKHYWYNLRKDMSCDEFFPVFLLYNRGRLNGFGWAFIGNMQSPHYEHPPHVGVRATVKEVPTCLYDQGTLSTMHVYMTSSPRFNFC